MLGGQISWESLPTGKYKFKIVLFRDCTGVSQSSQAEFLTNNAGTIINCTKTKTLYLNKECGAPLCNAVNYGYIGAVEAHIYESGPITLNGTPPPGGWYFSWSSCCRSSIITNLQSPASQSFALVAKMYAYTPPCSSTPLLATGYDSSPEFDEDPSLSFCNGYASDYFANAIDRDGDSIYYEWASPISSGIVPPFTGVNWTSGYSYNSPLPDTSFHPDNVPAVLDPQTGNVSFKSYTLGVYQTGVLAKSYRKGQLIAEVMRDVPVFVKPCVAAGMCALPPNYSVVTPMWTNPADSLVLVSGGNTSGFDTYQRVQKANEGDTVKFTLSAQDVDLLANCLPEVIEIKAWGTHVSSQLSNYTNASDCDGGYPCATIQSLNTGGSFASSLNNTVTFKWYVNCNLVGLKNEAIYVEVSNNSCPFPTIKRIKIVVPLNLPTYLQDPTFDTALSNLSASGDIELFWSKPDTANHFSHYVLWHQNGTWSTTILDTITNFVDTHYVHLAPPSGTNTYWIGSVGGCLNSVDTLCVLSDTVSNIHFKNNIGIEEQLQRLKIFPQPFTNHIDFEGFDNAYALNVQIWDVTGRLLK